MREDYEIQKKVNELLNRRCTFLLNRLFEIRSYIMICKEDKTTIDIDKLLEMLN